jgi:hypothetical protein
VIALNAFHRGNELLGLAYEWYTTGVVPLPLHVNSKRPAITWYDWQVSKPVWREVAEAFDTPFYRNIGLLTGAVSSNLVVLDFDTPLPYIHWKQRFGRWTYTVRTSRGFHAYLFVAQLPQDSRCSEGVEVKTSGYVVAPPSVHASGWVYQQYGECETIAEVTTLESAGLTLRPSVPLAPVDVPQHTGNAGLVDKIKRQLPIGAYLERYTQLFRSGPDYSMACCVLHDDARPSMWVNHDKNICGCFSPGCPAYARPLDVINLYAAMNLVNNREAIFELAERLGLL